MKTIWVLENIKDRVSYYSKFELTLLFASVIQWKKHHPTYTCELHADELTIATFKNLEVLQLWDSVKLVGKNKAIDKSVFWASSKLQALRYVEEPVVIMDNDFIVYRSFHEYLQDKTVVAHEEDGEGYYLGPLDGFIKQVKHIINRPALKAINCSFLYLPDFKFTQHYAKTSLELMQEFTKLRVPNSKYLIYAEQLLLKHLLDKFKIEYNSLITKIYDCNKDTFIQNIKGLIDFDQAPRFYRHYWKEKPKIKDSIDGFSYKEEMKQLENIVKNRILIDWSLIDVKP